MLSTVCFIFFIPLAFSDTNLVETYLANLKKYHPTASRISSIYGDDVSRKEHFLSFEQFKKVVDNINGDKSSPFTAELNMFSAMTAKERQMYTGLNMTYAPKVGNVVVGSIPAKMLASAPDSVDWIKEGYQPAVKDQGGCASSWAFAAISELESTYHHTTGKLETFSEENVISCSAGCAASWLDTAYFYIRSQKSVSTSVDVPYVGDNKADCKTSLKNPLEQVLLEGVHLAVGQGDKLLKSMVSKRVVAVGIEVTDALFAYKSGIYDGRGCGGTLNHAVTVVGYGKEKSGALYWNIRNSWGTDWGRNGYAFISRDVSNTCGISNFAYQSYMKCTSEECAKKTSSRSDSMILKTSLGNEIPRSKKKLRNGCKNIWTHEECLLMGDQCTAENVFIEEYMVMFCKKKCNKC